MNTLSVIIPILNEERNLRKFFEGYSIQMLRPNELIFVDGGSKDKTVRILNRMKR